MSQAQSRVTDQQIAYAESLLDSYKKASSAFLKRREIQAASLQYELVVLAYASELRQTYKLPSIFSARLGDTYFRDAAAQLSDDELNRTPFLKTLIALEASPSSWLSRAVSQVLSCYDRCSASVPQPKAEASTESRVLGEAQQSLKPEREGAIPIVAIEVGEDGKEPEPEIILSQGLSEVKLQLSNMRALNAEF